MTRHRPTVEQLAPLCARVRTEHLGGTTGDPTAPAGTAGQHAHTLTHLAAAQGHYSAAGYRNIAAPWIVSAAAHNATAPPNTIEHRITAGGHLVASGEQSFLQLPVDYAAGRPGAAAVGRAQTTTECFRYESDTWHQRHFWKVELIDTIDVDGSGLTRMVDTAAAFHSQYLDIDVVDTRVGLDIVCAHTGIELGSYGIRRARVDGHTHAWVYGTGCAEPRLTQVIAATT